MEENLTKEEKIEMLINQIEVCADDVLGEWSQAPYYCKEGLEAVSRLRGLLDIKEEKPYRRDAEESDVDYYKRIKEAIEEYRTEHPGS